MELIQHLVDASVGKHPIGMARSPHWPAVRQAHLLQQPVCAVCGGTLKLQVHHIRPFHLHPDLELEPSNLVTLCEANKGGLNCHLAFGHLSNFRSFNPDVIEDAKKWAIKLTTRPFSGAEQVEKPSI